MKKKSIMNYIKRRNKLVLAIVTVLIIFLVLSSLIVLMSDIISNKTGLVGMARKVIMMASNDQKYESDSKRDEEKPSSIADSILAMINQLKIQKEKEMYCSVVKDGAYSKITEENLFSKSCIDPTGDDLKIASGAFGYWIDMYAGKYDQNEIKEECVVEYDTCKEDGM